MRTLVDRIKGWKTIIVMTFMGVLGSLEAAFLFFTELLHEPAVIDVLPDWLHGYVPLIMAVAAVWLRTKTNTPVGKKES